MERISEVLYYFFYQKVENNNILHLALKEDIEDMFPQVVEKIVVVILFDFTFLTKRFTAPATLINNIKGCRV